MEKITTRESTVENSEFTTNIEAPIPAPSTKDDSPTRDVAGQVAEIEKQIAATLESGEVSGSADIKEAQNTPSTKTASEVTFLDRYPALGKWARSMMLVAGLGVAGSALGADKKLVEELEGDEVTTTVIVNGKEVSSTKKPQGKKITGATVTKDGKIIVDGKSTPLPKGSSVKVEQKMKEVTGTVVGVELK